MKNIVFTTLLILFIAVGYTQSYSSLVGTYSVKEKGQLKEWFKIEKQRNGFVVSEKLRGEWMSPQRVTPASKSDLEKMLKESVKVEFTGLGNQNVALIKSPKGWRSGKFQCNTGYWNGTVLGPIELYKQ